MTHHAPGPISTTSRSRRATNRCLQTFFREGRRITAPLLDFPFGHLTTLIQVIREIHETPRDVRERVTTAGGRNRLGEPNFRVVWGGARLTLIGGRWTDRDAHGNVIRERVELREVPKYLPLDRWHVERWVPPEAYGSPEEWYRRTMEVEDGIRFPALGPYPSRGEYEHCFTLQTAAAEFVSLTPSACDWVVRAIEWARRQTRTAMRSSIARREARRECYWDRVATDVLDESVRAFHGHPFVTRAASFSTAGA
jgi:hypothetical protein